MADLLDLLPYYGLYTDMSEQAHRQDEVVAGVIPVAQWLHTSSYHPRQVMDVIPDMYLKSYKVI